MIELKNIERSYKTGAGQTWVLRRVNLDIRQGEFITVMGPSGAGKSSLLNVLALLDDQWQGEYWFREEAVHELRAQAAGRTGQAQRRNDLSELSPARRPYGAGEYRSSALL